jgi:hypothetical protein
MEEKKKKKEHYVRIGEGLKYVLEKQKENIKKVTYECVEVSDLAAGEVIAKKIIKNKLI